MGYKNREIEMKFRISQWLDTSNDDVTEYPILFGIQANNGNGWAHCHSNGEPLIDAALVDMGKAWKEAIPGYMVG